MKPHDYQQKAIRFCLETKRVYLAMDLGTGKTLVALKVISTNKYPTLVLASLAVCYNVWPEEIQKWCPNLSYTILHGPKKNANLRLKRDIYILNYDGLKWFYNTIKKKKVPPMNLVVDESTNIKNPSTIRFKIIKALLPMFKHFRLALSATPINKGLQELWAQYYALDGGLTLFPTNSAYLKKYFRYDMYTYKYYIYKGAREEIYKRIKPVTYRIDGFDYLKLPPITYNSLQLTMPKKLQKQYDELKEEFYLSLGDQGVEAFNMASLSTKLRQFAQGALYTSSEGTNRAYSQVHDLKINALKELVDSSAGQPILCAIQFRFEKELIDQAFGPTPTIYGGVSAMKAKEYITRWNKGLIPLLLVHPASISEGVNLQAAGHIIVWLGIPWSLRLFIQLNGRVYRQGQKHGVFIHSILFKNTIDERVWEVLKRDDATQAHLLEAIKE